MAAYLIADVNVTDVDKITEYQLQVPKNVEGHGGKFLVRGGSSELLEGHEVPHRAVVLEFPDMATLKRWYESEAYGNLKAIRERAADSWVIAVEGV